MAPSKLPLQLGHVPRHEAVDVELAAAGEDPRGGADDRLGDGLQEVRRLRTHAVEVVLGDDAPLMYEEEPVGERLVEPQPHGPLGASGKDEPDPGDIARPALEHRHRSGSAMDARRRDELAHVLEGPAVVGRVLPAHVTGHETIGRRRQPRHVLR